MVGVVTAVRISDHTPNFSACAVSIVRGTFAAARTVCELKWISRKDKNSKKTSDHE